MPSEEVETFISLARKYLADVYTRLATEPVTAAEEAELWQLINGVEAAIRMRAVVLDLERDEIDRELEGIDREIEQRCRPAGQAAQPAKLSRGLAVPSGPARSGGKRREP